MESTIKGKISITFDSAKENKEKLFSTVKNAYLDVQKFFPKKLEPKVKIKVMYFRKEMDTIAKRNTKCWEVAGILDDSSICIFSPTVIAKVSKDPEGKMKTHEAKDVPKLIKHELVHLFFRTYLGRDLRPIWLDEGAAQCIAGQPYRPSYLIKKGFVPFKEIHTKQQWMKKPNYWQALAFVEFLIEKFGKKTFLALARSLEDKSYKEFVKNFFMVCGINFKQVEEEYCEWLEKK